jgi:KUP system potassium uptake protein
MEITVLIAFFGDHMSKNSALPSGPTSGSISHPNSSRHSHDTEDPKKIWALTLGAIGVVFGDIGTSPLYAIKECFSQESAHHIAVSHANVLGVLSLVFWSLCAVIVFKYITFIMRADNEGAGGLLALLALVPGKEGDHGAGKRTGRVLLLLMALFGTALLYGDGVITPAISVLSAMEGLEVVTKTFKPIVLPLTLGVLFALFWFQKYGTGRIGKVFGPVTMIWFLMIASLGVKEILAYPAIFQAVSPHYAVQFFINNRGHGFLILGSVFLVVTGGEALYADMGHFGRVPIRRAWYMLVFPSLLLNYFGQGAHLLTHPNAASNPFYALVPSWALIPAVVIATCATVVASQALISGAFSLTQQAVQMGYFPRVNIIHTSKEEEGQIYIPEVNRALLIACLLCVLLFKTSGALAAAYGIAVTGTMGITTIIYYFVLVKRWNWKPWKAILLCSLFISFDLAFFGANAVKFLDGGWFPLAMGIGIFTIMTTWHSGRHYLSGIVRKTVLPLDSFLEEVSNDPPHRVPGTAVFMASNPDGTPPILLHHFKHNKILHQTVILLTVQNMDVPEVHHEKRLTVVEKGEGFFQVRVRYGFMQSPNIPRVLAQCSEHGLSIDLGQTSYYLGRETLLSTGNAPLATWRKTLFAFISRNARPATSYFGLPPDRVIELGMQIDFLFEFLPFARRNDLCSCGVQHQQTVIGIQQGNIA